MPDAQNPETSPACPMCAGETYLKEVLKDAIRRLQVFKCLSCEVEYPIVAPASD